MKYTSIIRYVLIIVSVVVILLGAINDPGETVSGDHPWISAMLNWTYVVVGLAVGLIIIMSVFALSQNPKSAKRSLVGIGILALVLVVSWMLADTTPVMLNGGKTVYDDLTGLKITGMELYAAYIVFAGVILSIIFGEIYKLIKN